MPPLRQRKDDVPLLAAHFLVRVARELGRPRPRLTRENVDQLQAYSWPGNVRELRNVIERAVILASTGELTFDLPRDVSRPPALEPPSGEPTPEKDILEVIPESEMRRKERANLIAALESSGWRVYGSGGAAERLGIKPSTLASRIKKMGIVKPGR